ncbi:MAG: TIGR04211 family SH3 domain-containing protein [Desulfobacterales bacterium]|nr:TIGR04211 family SH3 domain-containing protein [Desulfobacterales bacterium]MBF0396571.1 TIGR04211 family SH3 domain-containing protein [Desulfobacterales bacterium]
MKYCIVISSIFLLYLTVYAETEPKTMYVSGILNISVRSGQGMEYKVITTIRSGQKVEIVEETSTSWTKVKAPDGKAGWVSNRLLTSEEPCDAVVEKLQKKHVSIDNQSGSLKEENKKLMEENKKISNELALSKDNLNKLNQSYEKVKADCSNTLSIKSNYDKANKKLAEKTEEIQKLETELSKQIFYEKYWWFFSGAGVFLGGLIFGRITGGKKKTSSLLN